jgi:hypothetical protein
VHACEVALTSASLTLADSRHLHLFPLALAAVGFEAASAPVGYQHVDASAFGQEF